MSFNSTEWVFSVLSFQVCSVDNWKVTPHKHFVSTSFSFVITYSNTIAYGSFRIDQLYSCTEFHQSIKVELQTRSSIHAVLILISGLDPGFEIGGAQNARVSARKFFQYHTHFQVHNHLGIVTLSSQLAPTSMRWLKITILRLFVATAVNIKAFLMQEQGDCSPGPYPLNTRI